MYSCLCRRVNEWVCVCVCINIICVKYIRLCSKIEHNQKSAAFYKKVMVQMNWWKRVSKVKDEWWPSKRRIYTWEQNQMRSLLVVHKLMISIPKCLMICPFDVLHFFALGKENARVEFEVMESNGRVCVEIVFNVKISRIRFSVIWILTFKNGWRAPLHAFLYLSDQA